MLTQEDAIWKDPIFVCSWENTKHSYTLNEVIGDGQGPKRLCNWLIQGLSDGPHKVMIIKPGALDDNSMYMKDGYTDDVVYYLLDYNASN